MESSVYILAGKRIPTGKFGGAYKNSSAVDLGAELMEKLIECAPIARSDVQGLYIGNVISSMLGQHPANQIKDRIGLYYSTDAAEYQKVCSSGLLAVKCGYREIASGDMDVVIAGGIESMSNAPFLMKRPEALYDPHTILYSLSVLQKMQERYPGYDFQNPVFTDSLQSEGLCDAFFPRSPVMGEVAEGIIRDHGMSRETLDAYAYESYCRVEKSKEKISRQFVYIKKSPQFDEGWRPADMDKIRTRPPVFRENGTLTVANSSQLADGAAALILVSEKQMTRYRRYGKEPMARIIAFGHAGLQSREFLRAPAVVIQNILKKAGLRAHDIDLFEINEAFPPAPLFAIRELRLDVKKVNPWGGAIANGHPLGASGAKILINLCYALRDMNGRYGIAAICNGGGEAMAVLIENCKN